MKFILLIIAVSEFIIFLIFLMVKKKIGKKKLFLTIKNIEIDSMALPTRDTEFETPEVKEPKNSNEIE